MHLLHVAEFGIVSVRLYSVPATLIVGTHSFAAEIQGQMIKKRITQWCRKHPTSASTLLIKGSNSFLSSLPLFFATLTGYIPLHTIRFVLYRFAFGVDVPKDSIIYWRCRFNKPSLVHIGHHSIIGPDAFLDGRHGLYIGNNVSIAFQVLIFTREHDINSPTFEGVGGPVFIEDRVFIGSRATDSPQCEDRRRRSCSLWGCCYKRC